MISHYIKSALRHFTRHKLYTAINVFGLALGVCGCLIIFLIASFEFSFDRFHPDKDRIYCVDASVPDNTAFDRGHWNSVPPPMADAMRSEMSGL